MRRALDDPPPGEVAAVRVEQQDPGHDPEPEGQDDHREVLRLEPERLLGEGRPEDAQHADERGRDAEVDERPGDRPDWPRMKVKPSWSWPSVEPDGAAPPRPRPSPPCGDSSVDGGGGDAGQRDAEDRGEEVQPGDDEDDRLRPGDLDDQRPEQREARARTPR